MSNIEDISSHNSPKGAWVMYKGKVLDISSFIHTHPGGESILLPYIGLEISKAFESVGHSQFAESLLQTLYIDESLNTNNI